MRLARTLNRSLLFCSIFTGCVSADVLLPQADGSTLVLPQPAGEIVTLSPHLAELVFAAGAGSHLVATVEYSDFPQEVTAVPRVGDAFRIDVERIVSLKPGLVIAWDSGNPRQAVEQLRSLGIPVWSLEIREPDEIAGTLIKIGEASGRTETAEAAAFEFRQKLESLAARYASRPETRYFYQVAERPLFTINDDHLIARGLRLCGGRNIFADEAGLAFQVSYESVIVANPDVLFAPNQESAENPLQTWLEWPGMKAVQSGALLLLPADEISRATPRWLDAIEIACRLIDDLPQRRNHE
jgi:iron complex transport system substrate-binding protein